MNSPRLPPILFHRPRTSAWVVEHSLSIFLALTLLIVFVVLPISTPGGPAEILAEILFFLALVSGTVRVARKKHVAALSMGLLAATLILRYLRLGGIVAGTASVETALIVVLLALMAVVILIDVFHRGPINTDRILGAVAVYLLLVLTWAHGYLLLNLFVPGALQPPGSDSSSVPTWWSMVYFSLATVTTVGYGNVTIAHPVAQSMAMLEALVGQLYPAILIGRLVGAWSSKVGDE